MSEGLKKAPKLLGMNYKIEELVKSTEAESLARIGDQDDLNRRYFLRIIHRQSPDDDARIVRAQAMVEASAKLSHPSLLTYHDIRLKRSWFRITRAEVLQEYVDAAAISEFDPTKVRLDHWILIYHQLASALSQIHRRNLLHGDIKPANVLLTRSGRAKLAGYGMNLVDNRDQRPTSKSYNAPEQAESGRLSRKADLYSLAATMYWALTGQPPKVDNRGLSESGKIPKPNSLTPQIPDPLNILLMTCLTSDPDVRPEVIVDVHDKLADLIQARNLDEASLQGLIGTLGFAPPKAEELARS